MDLRDPCARDGGHELCRILRRRADHGQTRRSRTGAGTWLYQFAYVPQFRKTEWKNGAIHSAELMFTFHSIDTSSWSQSASRKADDADRAFAKKVNSCWIAFYKMDPHAKSLSCADGLVWPAYTEANDEAMQFKDPPQLVKSKTIPNGPMSPARGGS
jgi:para-nitrobenzyl esterase